MPLCAQAETEVQTLTKRVRQLEEDFEQTETRLHTANEKFAEASKAADESERSESLTACMRRLRSKPRVYL